MPGHLAVEPLFFFARCLCIHFFFVVVRASSYRKFLRFMISRAGHIRSCDPLYVVFSKIAFYGRCKKGDPRGLYALAQRFFKGDAAGGKGFEIKRAIRGHYSPIYRFF